MARMIGKIYQPRRCRYRCCVEWELRNNKRKRGVKTLENKQWLKDFE